MEKDYGMEKLRIQKLTGPNYPTWSIQVKRLLVSKMLWQGIEPEAAPKDPAASGTTEPESTQSTVDNAKASTIIMGLCASNALQHILLLDTAKEQWEALKALYRPLGLQQLSAKIQAFTAYRPPETGATVAEIATGLSTLQYEIGAISANERPTDTLKRSILFQAVRALDPRFGPLILQLEISDTGKDYSTIVTHLSEFERRLGPKEALKEAVFAAQAPKHPTKLGNGGLKKGAFRGKCFNCNKPGHRAADCRAARASGRVGTGPLATPRGRQGISPPPEQPVLQAIETSWMATTSLNAPTNNHAWVVDSGCSRHMTFDREVFTEYTLLETSIPVTTASGTEIQAIAEGSTAIKIARNDGTTYRVTLTGVLHVPRLAGSLISVTQLQDRGITIRTTTGTTKHMLIIELQGAMIGTASRIGRAYVLDSEPHITKSPVEIGDALQNHLAVDSLPTTVTTTGLRALKATTDAGIWHCRLGHLSPQRLQGLEKVTTGLEAPIPVPEEPCEHCQLTKSVRIINRKSPERATKPLQRIHSDIWGPYRVPTLYGHTYMVTFTDDYTRKSWVYLLKARGQLRAIFTEFKTLVELESGHKITIIRCDNGPEYVGLGTYFQQDYGIQFEYTTAYTHEQVGVAERLNRSLITMVRAMLLDGKLPLRFWGDAVLTACYLRNRLPIGPNGTTPEEAYSGRKPNVGHLRAYGSVAYAHIPAETRLKIAPTAEKTCLVGYMPTARQYRLYSPERRRIVIATAPKFDENKRLDYNWEETLPGDLVIPFDPMEPVTEASDPEASGPSAAINIPSAPTEAEDDPEIEDTIEVVVPGRPRGLSEEPVPATRRGQRIRKQPSWYGRAYSAVEAPRIPKNYTEATTDPENRGHWVQAIRDELTKLQALDTWEVTKLPPGKKAIGCKWVFTVKYTPTGLIDRYKGRLVAQGFSQVPGDDFLETFSPTIRAESLRTLLAIGAAEDLEIRQVDVVSAYPRSKLHATVYMQPPEGLDCPKGSVLLVKKSLYGLKQSGREWYIEACKGLESLGLMPCYSEPSVFTTVDRSLIVGLYVDDMLILGSDPQAIERTVQGIRERWEIKDLGPVAQILGLHVQRDRPNRTLRIDQGQYIQALISRFRLVDAKPVTLPVADRHTLYKAQDTESRADQSLYQQAIGCLTWVSKGTRPDLGYAVGQLSQHCSEPTVRHWNAVLRVLRYLKGTKHYAIGYGFQGATGSQSPKPTVDSRLQGYCDADYAGDTVDRHSITGHIYMLNGGPITWNSTKQRCVATSTTESEYIALAESGKQGQWLRALLKELQCTNYLTDTLGAPIYSDNQACIAISQDPISHQRTKHIDVRYHYIRELIAYGKTTVEYLPTESMLADILTKPLGITAYRRCIQGILQGL
jgi:hypothetical protein